MSTATKELPKLTTEQEQTVWRWICANKHDDDAEPHEVIEERYKGNKSAYLQDMADYLQACGKLNLGLSDYPL